MRQSYQQELLPNVGLALNGELVRIGTAQDAFCERAKDDYIGFEIIWNDGKKGIWRFSYDHHGYPVEQNEVPPRIIKPLQQMQNEEDC
ncbi:MAG: hypothetical protein HEQ35_28780 [Gloeotrichia echinulata IR180]